MKPRNIFLCCLVAALLCSSANGQSNFVDFEDAKSYGGDDAVVTNDYFSQYGFTVSGKVGRSASTASDLVLSFEQTGKDKTDAWNSNAGIDTAVSGNLGNYFVKAGVTGKEYNNAKYFTMSINYNQLSDKVSGELWDVDGPEKYSVTAYDKDGSAIATLTTPDKDLSGQPWTWAFDSSGGKKISSVQITAIGTGVLRDFSMDNMQAFAAPIPAALPLGCAGVSMIALYNSSRSRRKKLHSTQTDAT